MGFETQSSGLDEFLATAYGLRDGPYALLAQLGFGVQQVEQLSREHPEKLVTFCIALLKERVATYRVGERLYHVLSRRFGLDGNQPETLQSIGQRLDVSRERVRQLERKALTKCRSKAHRQNSAAGLRALAMALLTGPQGEPPLSPQVGGEPAVPREALASSPDASEVSSPSSPSDVTRLIASILQTVGYDMTCNILAHILAGSDGPVTTSLVTRYQLTEHGALRPLRYAAIKRMIRETCGSQLGLELVDGRVRLEPKRGTGGH